MNYNDFNLLESNGDAVWVIDQNQKILYWNKKSEEVFGYNKKEVFGKYCYNIFRGKNLSRQLYCQKECIIHQKVSKLKPVKSINLILLGKNEIEQNIVVNSVFLGNQKNREFKIIHMGKKILKSSFSEDDLSIHLLGPCHIYLSDRSRVNGSMWNRMKVKSLMAFLTINHGKYFHRERLLNLFWPKLEYGPALANLNTTVYNLRHSLEPFLKPGSESKYIIYEQDHYSLSSDMKYWIDYREFERKIQQAQQENNPEEAVHKFQEALVLYKGDFIENLVDYNSWAIQSQMYLRDLYLRSKENLGDLYLQLNQSELSLKIYSQILNYDPTREEVAEKIIQSYLQRGIRPMAIHHYSALEKSLYEQFGLKPRKRFDQYLQPELAI